MPKALDQKTLALGARPGVLVVDAMNAFTDPNHPLGAEVGAEIEVINKLLGLAQEQGWPSFFSAVWYESANEASVFRSKVPALNALQPGSADVAIDPRLLRSNSDSVFRKTHASCFFASSLDDDLKKRKVDSLIVCGFSTSGCVRATVVDALQYNYPTYVIADAVSDRDDQAHQANLYDMGAKYAEVVAFAELHAEVHAEVRS